jgi:hypothetical protein
MSAPELLPDPDPEIASLDRDLQRARAESYPLTFEVRRLAAQADPPARAVDALCAELEYKGLGEAWIEIPRRIAAKMLTHLIGSDLAYPDEIVPQPQAEALGGRFLALFPAGTRYFTNGALSGEFAVYDAAGGEVLGWRSISEAPLDNGVAAGGGGRVGMLWAEDAM